MGKRIKSQTIKHLPHDILEDIFLNLPIKSLLRFKSVSKPWRSLISSKHFSKAHLNKSSHNLIYTSYIDATRSHTLRSCSMKSFLAEQNPMVTTSYHDPFGAKPVFVRAIVGSCNGLILISTWIDIHWSDLILWNPSTKQVKNIPQPPLYARRHRYRRSEHFVYGFGYDDSTDDYKVVCIFASHPGIYKTQMYSLRTNSWKKIGKFEKGYRRRRCSATHVNGKLHYWLASQEGRDVNEDVVSLSLVDGKFDIVPLPRLFVESSSGSSRYRSFYILDNLGGYLSLVSQDPIGTLVHFWVMKKYSEVESWTSRVISLNLNDPMRPTNGLRPRPIWLTKNGEVIVGIGGSRFVLSNEQNQSQVYVVDTEISVHHTYDRYGIYVESLVSP